MEPYNEDAAVKYNKLSSNENWLRKRQGLALPALPPTTPEARKYFFFKIRHFAALASENGHGKINFEAFAQEWNQSADGIVRFYVTAEVLSAYAKSWEKTSNIHASQELIKGKIDGIQQTRNVFAATLQPFPTFLTATPVSVHPCQGVIDVMEVPSANIPASISTELAISHPVVPAPQIPSMCVPPGLELAEKHNNDSETINNGDLSEIPEGHHSMIHRLVNRRLAQVSALKFYSETLILKKNGLQNDVVLFLRVNGNEERVRAAVARSKHVQV